MAFQDFIKIERTHSQGRKIQLVHRKKPSLMIEVIPQLGKNGEIRGGTIKRIRVPNSCQGDYHKYAKLIADAERFFLNSLQEDGPARF